METTMVGYIIGLYTDDGKTETTIMGDIVWALNGDNGKDNGNYCNGFRVWV